MQYVWQPREWDPQQAEKLQVGWVPPILGMHEDAPLIQSRLTTANDPAAKVVITAGESFVPNDPWLEKYCNMDRSFRRVRNGIA